jgi:Skp family chaperone for outer membrane proteins
MKRFQFAAILFLFIGMIAATAEDGTPPRVKAGEPKALPADVAATGANAVTDLKEDLEILEAQRQVKAGYCKAAEVARKQTELKLGEQKNAAEVDDKELAKARHELEAAQALCEIRAGELKEVELKIKFARQKLEKVQAIVGEQARAKVLQAAGGAVVRAGGFGGVGLAGLDAQNTPAAAAASKVAVFNMAVVMKDYNQAKYGIYLLTEERKTLTSELGHLKTQHMKLSQEVAVERNAAVKDEKQQQLLDLTREIEDRGRKIDKQLNEKASHVIVELYDDIKAVVDEIAREKGYDIMFAYPDATGDDANTPYVKELKLKPPAAQPFFVGRHVDATQDIVHRLNARHPAPSVPMLHAPPPPPLGSVPHPGLPGPLPNTPQTPGGK